MNQNKQNPPISPMLSEKLANLCANIKGLRLQSGLTQRELSERLSIPLSLLEEAERGILSDGFTSTYLVSISSFFHIPIDRLFVKFLEA
ncbi:MAG: helix-turn-helix transcriptional regulator [Clostridiales bacterium]|nr:helix-turn-helix transcriptional regulator [Clostridiales bacterium]